MSEEQSASRYSGDASSVIPLSQDLSVVPLFFDSCQTLGIRVMVRWRRRYCVAVHSSTTLAVVAGPHFSHTAHLLALMEVSFPVMDDMLLSTQSITFLLVFACLVLLSVPFTPTAPPLNVDILCHSSDLSTCLSPRVHWLIVAHRCLSFLVPCLADTTHSPHRFSLFSSRSVFVPSV